MTDPTVMKHAELRDPDSLRYLTQIASKTALDVMPGESGQMATIKLRFSSGQVLNFRCGILVDAIDIYCDETYTEPNHNLLLKLDSGAPKPLKDLLHFVRSNTEPSTGIF